MKKRVVAISILLLTACSSTADRMRGSTLSAQQLKCAGVVPGTVVSNDFVCAHNSVRERVSPAANPPLPAVSWNAELAAVAQAYAETCTFEHNKNRSTEFSTMSGEKRYVGENLYMTTSNGASPYDAVASWASEAANYHYRSNRCDSGEVCGHYTQVVWRSSVEIGCGVKSCNRVSGGGFGRGTIVVCNYAPGGNYVGEMPY
ncbi:MAG: CAP domain-containing protein [Chromatiales bacterium]|nr:CAP domain-containing protein [Chromatiales bacterium]